MLVVRDLADVPAAARGSVFAIGNFDGVHRGHRVLFDRVFEISKQAKIAPGAMVFEPHPREFFRPDEPHFRLTPLEEKLRLIADLGLDFVVVLDFDAQLAKLTAHDFIDRVLVQGLAARHVVVGYDFLFGRGRSGSAQTLEAEGKKLGFDVSVIAPQGAQGTTFSSSDVRKHLALGDVAAAAQILGRWWCVGGDVIEGKKLGKELGFPTANLKLENYVALEHGIYAVYAHVEGKRYEGVAYFGSRPAVGGDSVLLEVHIFDFDDEIYGSHVRVEFVEFLRGDKAFDALEDLKSQIALDCDGAKRVLSVVMPPWQ